MRCGQQPRCSSSHHAFAAEFDATQPVTIEGTVTSVEWTNPHMWLHVDVKDEKCNVVNCAIEGGAPKVLLRRGLRRDSLPPRLVPALRGRGCPGQVAAHGKQLLE